MIIWSIASYILKYVTIIYFTAVIGDQDGHIPTSLDLQMEP